jgi:DNA glycosylase AlkZ-like
VNLWSRLEGFERDALTRALERKRAVQGTLMRSTIHVVSPRDYWAFAEGVGRAREQWWLRTAGKGLDGDPAAVAEELRARLAGRVVHRTELDAILAEHGGTIWAGVWVPLVRVPPSGTWERRRADLLRLAEEWLGPSDTDEERGLVHLLRSYLRGFGPARLADAADWAGVPVTALKPAAERVELRRFRDERGKELLDLPRAALPPAETPAPVRFLPVWDATLLVHARRTQLLPEQYRPLVFNTKIPHSVNTFLVDGQVAGTWRVERTESNAELALRPFARLAAPARAELAAEGERLVRFHEPDAQAHAVRFLRR